ncbi:trans-aconitate 2-methyltransferase [Pseudonocardia sediminis]|uniref:Trans-aconitate 2-methyltransferase n=1 Tax=Pseudonocardia sediminis TaxID=1397368 RepID=A0A4Q7UZY8_PSEST|nr:trans-aconitate 2-methyltransferase [Pseudonocardia sediminis]RZT87576.1 trans-aconitate 2-methyltransferase [Pseudonocardia sediminis]
MTTSWDPALYRNFDDHRSRPFHDLVARIGSPPTGDGAPRRVVDAGCGPGHLTPVLARRWPEATVEAFDASPDMVASARDNGVAADLVDVADWTPAPDTGVVVSNAILQWVPTHAEILTRWVKELASGAWIAVQVPGNFEAPSHVLTREVATQPRWRDRMSLRGAVTVLDPAGYADLLTAAGADADVWETTYLQRLTGDDPVLRWISGTALRPVRDALDDGEYAAFVEELSGHLRMAYPPSADGTTWFPFRRIFAVARVR